MRSIAIAVALLAVVVTRPLAAVDQKMPNPLRTFSVRAADCTFTPNELTVDQGDRVLITFTASGAPHSLVIEAYGVFRRATPDHPVTIEFLADIAGRFPFYSNLVTDRSCDEMSGELVVRAKAIR